MELSPKDPKDPKSKCLKSHPNKPHRKDPVKCACYDIHWTYTQADNSE